MNDHDPTQTPDCRGVRIGLAGADDIRGRSAGEIRRPGTIDPATGRPVPEGLYCARIFGPEGGPARGGRDRHRLGHIELAAPVVHVWYFGRTNLLAGLLGTAPGDLRNVIYHHTRVVTDPGATPLKAGEFLTDDEFDRVRAQYGDAFRAGTGAAAVRELLRALDPARLAVDLRAALAEARRLGASALKVRALARRIELVESLRGVDNRPEWLVLDCLPVVAPALRRDAHRRADGDRDELYARIIRRNLRLRKLTDLGAPEVILRNERRALQQAVDALLDNGRARRTACDRSGRPLRSLTDRLKDGRSRVRAGKRVDYSARSVAVPGPELKLHQCGLPAEIALELFRPFVLGWLIRHGTVTVRDRAAALAREFRPDADPPPNWPQATRRVRDLGPVVWTALANVMRGRAVLLSRRPVVDRARLRAFEPVLTEGRAVRVPPLVCGSMGLGFDGGQVLVHLPLSAEAQVETELLSPVSNLFDPATGTPTLVPAQDIVVGCYHLTAARGGEDEAIEAGDGMTFHSPAEVLHAHAEGKLGVHARIRVRLPVGKQVVSEVRDGPGASRAEDLPRPPNGLIRTTVGRVLFNDILPPQMAFYDLPLGSEYLNRIRADCDQRLGRTEAVALLDRIKETGFREATRSGLSLAIGDLRTPDTKAGVLKDTDQEVERARKIYVRGYLSEVERFNRVIELWTSARQRIDHEVIQGLANDRRPDPVTGKAVPDLNPLDLMARSGARVGLDQLRRLAGMWGLLTDPAGGIIELPIRSNFREGLTALEYWSAAVSCRATGRRERLKPVEAAHLRRLIDLAGDVRVTMSDCGTREGVTTGRVHSGAGERSIGAAVRGRVARRALVSAHDGSVVVNENGLISGDTAQRIERLGIDRFRVRSPLTCRAPSGVCRMCYGADAETGRLVEEGAAVGMRAAHAIGAGVSDLIPPVARAALGSGRSYEGRATCRRGGVVRFENVPFVTNDRGERIALVVGHGAVRVLREWDRQVLERHSVPHGAVLLVEDGAAVDPGNVLCRWDPEHDLVVAPAAGRVEFRSLVPGETVRVLPHPDGQWEVAAHRGDADPHVLVREADGRVTAHYLREATRIEVRDGQAVAAGTVLGRRPRVGHRGTVSIDAPARLRDILDARPSRRTAVLAEVPGVVHVGELVGESRVVRVQPTESGVPVGAPVEHAVGSWCARRVGTGDRVERGEPLTYGDAAPRDLLRVLGPEAAWDQLLRDIRDFFRARRVSLDDRHIEVMIAQLLRHVRVNSSGDTDLVPGSLATAADVRRANARLADHPRTEGAEPPVPATATPVLMSLTQAVASTGEFLAPPASRDHAALIAAAALAGRVSRLTGLRENVTLGRLVPAGTGWPGEHEIEGREAGAPGDGSNASGRTSLHNHPRPSAGSPAEGSPVGGAMASLACVRRRLREVQTTRRVAERRAQRLAARLDALVAARAAALATLRHDEPVEVREAKADVAASLCEEIEGVKDELYGRRGKIGSAPAP